MRFTDSSVRFIWLAFKFFDFVYLLVLEVFFFIDIAKKGIIPPKFLYPTICEKLSARNFTLNKLFYENEYPRKFLSRERKSMKFVRVNFRRKRLYPLNFFTQNIREKLSLRIFFL